MLLKPTSRFHEALDRKTRYQSLVLACCILFGVAMIANVQSAADGSWFWYAVFLAGGKRLYADMHLVLQPLFVLETAGFLALFGKGWLVSKIPALLHLVAYCFGLFLLARHSRLPDWQKAIILGCAFFVSISFEAYRLDDYHVLSNCLQLYSILALLSLQKSVTAAQSFGLVVGLGVLSGLALTNRLNDGAALVVGVVLGIFCLAPSRRLMSVALFGLISMLTVVLIVHLTGDSFRDYATYSILRAAGSKGGTSNVLLAPLILPWNALLNLKVHWYVALNLYGIGAAAVWVFLSRWSVTAGPHRRLIRLIFLAVLVLLPLRIHHIYRGILNDDFVISLTAIATPAAYILGALVLVRFMRWLLVPASDWNRAEILLLLPLGQLASASMSSGGRPNGLYQPLAVMMLLLPFASPIQIRKESRTFLLALAVLLTCSCAVYKATIPFKWHSYRAAPMFVGRQWYRHPVYGPMIIETTQLELISQICRQIETGGPPVELLSLPFPYANYFCSIPPWHGYVQTFFDISNKGTIFGLMQELEQAPPKWVLYQRQLDNLKLHEEFYNHGQPLPHRYLDEMIEQKLDSGRWEKVYVSNYEAGSGWRNEWILIRTRP